MTEIAPGYTSRLGEIKGRIRSAQYDALRAVNNELIGLYWDIGRLIADWQRGGTWGQSVVEQQAADIRNEFPWINGFSERNIRYMRTFYLEYHAKPKLQPLVAEIGWTHNLIILERCKDEQEREFYLLATKKFGWTKNVLIHQLDNQAYRKTLSGQTNFDAAVSEEIHSQPKLAVKDEYTFDFLELGDEHSERMLETAILARVEPFLKEMGGMFTFVGSQFRLEVGDQEYSIDLLLYHRRLRCLTALELKVGAFLPEYIGKMQFYLAALDDTVRLEGEAASIGIILCRSKDRTIVEYSLRDATRPIGIATYTVTQTVPQELYGQLPEPDQVARLLEGLAED